MEDKAGEEPKKKKRRRKERSNLREEIKEEEDRGELMKSKVGDGALEVNTESVDGEKNIHVGMQDDAQNNHVLVSIFAEQRTFNFPIQSFSISFLRSTSSKRIVQSQST